MADPIIRGDTALWSIPIMNILTDPPTPMDLSGCSIWVTVKANKDDPDSEAIYQHSMSVGLDGQVAHSDGMTLGEDGAAAGIAVQELTPVESALLTPGNYTYDVQVMLPNGRIFTPILGESEEIVGDITHAITPAGE